MIPEHLKTDQEKDAYVAGKLGEFNAVISFAHTALKVPILINGGAAIAILALIGNTWKDKSFTAYLAASLLFFTVGVLTAAVGTGLSYLAQQFFLEHEDEEGFEKAKKWQLITIGCIIVSYITFALGSFWAAFVLSFLIST